MRLTDLALVKRTAGLRLDTDLSDNLLLAMIEQASERVENLTRRKFLKTARTEHHRSYEQILYDPTPQYVHLDAFPVDLALPLIVTYAFDGIHIQGNFQTLTKDTHFEIDPATGILTILPTSFALVTTTPLIMGTSIYQDCPRGFKVTYTGGYHLGTGAEDQTIQVPDGLKSYVSRKVARDYLEIKALKPFDEKDLEELGPWRKIDILF